MPRPSRQAASPPRPRVRPVQARALRRIDEILDVTAGLLATHGLEAVSTTLIAEEAGMPVATIYHYFENRLGIFAALAKRTMDRVDAGLAMELHVLSETPKPDWRQVLGALYAAYRDTPGYVAVLRALRAEPALRQLMRISNERIAQVIAGLLQSRVSLPPERAARIAWIISEACEQVLQQALLEPGEADALLDELASIVDVLFRHYVQR